MGCRTTYIPPAGYGPCYRVTVHNWRYGVEGGKCVARASSWSVKRI